MIRLRTVLRHIHWCVCRICSASFPSPDPTASDCGAHGVPRR